MAGVIVMSGEFAGSTAAASQRFRRDVPAAVIDDLIGHLGLGTEDRANDLGAGTAQVASVETRRTALGRSTA